MFLKPFVAKCIEVIGDGITVAERAGALALYNVKDLIVGLTPIGGLGWALPAALGFQLANKEGWSPVL